MFLSYKIVNRLHKGCIKYKRRTRRLIFRFREFFILGDCVKYLPSRLGVSGGYFAYKKTPTDSFLTVVEVGGAPGERNPPGTKDQVPVISRR